MLSIVKAGDSRVFIRLGYQGLRSAVIVVEPVELDCLGWNPSSATVPSVDCNVMTTSNTISYYYHLSCFWAMTRFSLVCSLGLSRSQ